MSDLLAFLAVAVGYFLLGLGVTLGIPAVIGFLLEERARRQRVRRRRQIERNTHAAVRQIHARYRSATEQAVRHAAQRTAEQNRGGQGTP